MFSSAYLFPVFLSVQGGRCHVLLLRDRRIPSRQSQHSGGGGESPSEGALLPALTPSDEVTAHQGTARSLIRDVFIYPIVVCVCAVITGVCFLQEKEIWLKRPSPVPLLKVMALSVIHLMPLRLVLLDTLMTDYMSMVDSYLNSSYYEPDELAHVSMVSNSQMGRCRVF